MRKILTPVFFCMLFSIVLISCKKNSDQNNPNASFEKLGDQLINNITGFALNGDPLCRSGNGDVVRWRSATSDWGRVGDLTNIPSGYFIEARCEDAQGNFYGVVINNGNYTLPTGTGNWIKLVLPDIDTIAYGSQEQYDNAPFANNKGDIAVQTHRIKNGADHIRIYIKTAGSSTWTIASDRTLDYARIVCLADNGDVFLQNKGIPGGGPTVLKAGSNVVIPVADCAGSTILPYCGSDFGVNPAGDIAFHGGTRHMYLMKSATTYPSTAELVYDIPENTCCFNNGFYYLSDGTALGMANMGGYDEYFLYIRKSGASNWYKAPSLPSDGGITVYIKVNAKGELFTASLDPYATNGTGPLFRIHY